VNELALLLDLVAELSQLSKSKVLNSGLMTRATPRYRSENARLALVT